MVNCLLFNRDEISLIPGGGGGGGQEAQSILFLQMNLGGKGWGPAGLPQSWLCCQCGAETNAGTILKKNL